MYAAVDQKRNSIRWDSVQNPARESTKWNQKAQASPGLSQPPIRFAFWVSCLCLRFALDSGFLVCASVYPLGEEVAVFGVGVLGSSLHMSGEGLLVRGCVHLPGKQARADGLRLAAGVSSLLQSHFKHFYQNQLFVMFPQSWTLHSQSLILLAKDEVTAPRPQRPVAQRNNEKHLAQSILQCFALC